jgi:hypothetical protein
VRPARCCSAALPPLAHGAQHSRTLPCARHAQLEAAAAAAALRAAVAPSAARHTPQADLEALRLEDVLIPSMQQAVRALFEARVAPSLRTTPQQP